MWEPIELPELPGQIIAVSDLNGEQLAVWTDAGIHLLNLYRRPRLVRTLAPNRGPERFDQATGCFRWRGVLYQMHGACGPDGAVVGKPLPTEHPSGMTLERDGDRLLVRDVTGTVRQVIEDCGGSAPWSVAGILGYRGCYLFIAHPGSVRLFRYAGSPEGGGAVWQRAGDTVTQQSLLRAIIDNPDDDTTRLVYSDWLEEHGDPARAEFIRVQCRIAERLQSADVPHGDPDERRAYALLETNLDRWTAELPTLPGVEYNFYRSFRGFPEVVFSNPDGLVRHGPRIREATPIEAVHFGRLLPRPLGRLLRTSFPESLCRLSAWELPAETMIALARWLHSPRAERLRRIRIGQCSEWTALLWVVVDSEHLGRLEELWLESGLAEGPPEERAVLALARSPRLPRLRAVSFAWWHLYPERTKDELRQRFPAIPLK